MAPSDDNSLLLSRSRIPVFPDKCVVCGRTNPASKVRVATDVYLGWVSFLRSGRQFAVEIPACRMCCFWFRITEWGGTALAVVLAAIIYWHFGPTVAQFVPRRLSMLAIFAICFPVAFIWHSIFRTPLKLSASPEWVSYKFKDDVYKNEFFFANFSGESSSGQD